METILIKKEYIIASSISNPKLKKIFDEVNSVAAIPPGINEIKPTKVENVCAKAVSNNEKSIPLKEISNL